MEKREIKFRIWDNINRIMIQDDIDLIIRFMESGLCVTYMATETKESGGELREHDCIEEIYDYSIMQYTGIKDIKGKPIYEGDIVSAINGFASKQEKKEGIEDVIFKLPIKFLNGAFCIVNEEDDNRYGLLMNYMHKERQLTIIGNIYEQSEIISQ